MERNVALKLMYNGSAYHGWQVQKNAVTVAETLEQALATVVGHTVKCTGAGRTDAGVHAETYIANFRTTSRIPLDKLPLAVNTRLPNDIVVVKATEVPEGFNAIGSCHRKEYTYRIYNSRLGNPFFVDRAWFYPRHLDERVMQAAASQFVGTHDFRAVRSVGTETRTTVRTVYYFDVKREGDLIECKVCANGSSITWCGPWWAPSSTPPRASWPRRTSPPFWSRGTEPWPDPPSLPADCT